MSVKSRLVSAVGSVTIAWVVLGIPGCSEELGPERMPVTRVEGSVTEGGRPLSRGWVEFFPVDGTVGNLRSARIRTDGSFETDGVAVGRNLIRLVNAGIRPNFGIFSTFQSSIRRLIPAQPREPVRIELVDEAIRFQSTLSPKASSGSSGAGGIAMSRLSPASVPANDAAIIGNESIIRMTYRDGTGVLHTDWQSSRVEESLRDQAGILWVDIQGPEEHSTPHVADWLRDVFHFHPLAIEDALKESHIPKVDDWGDYLYLVFHVAEIKPNSDVLELQELDIFLGPNYLVTYHAAPLSILDQDRLNIERDPRERFRNGPDHVLIRFLELAVDQSLTAIELLDDRVDAIQEAIIEHASPKNLQAIFRVKRSAIELHKNLGPQREVLTKLARDPYKPVQPKHRVYFRDLYDHVVRIHDISESLRDLITGALDTYLSVVSNRTNDIMKTLTIVTVMFLPMSFLTSFFGMNFFGEALALQGPLPKSLLFWASCAIMAVSPCFIWIYARRRKWF